MKDFMNDAYKEAQKAYGKNEVPIGCVIVKDGKIVARAHNLREKNNLTTSHSEILCIEKACKKLNSWRLDGCDMYVTLEPCLMCAGAITQARIKKVYIGAKDEKNGCVGSIANVFLDVKTTHKVDFEYKLNDNCSSILSIFFKNLRKSKI